MRLENRGELLEQATSVIPGGVNTSLRRVNPFLVFKEAHGAIVTDVSGKEYIDYHAAFGPIMLGHNFEFVSRRVRETMERIDLIGVGTTEIEIELAKKICKLVPSAEKVLFCNSGSEATYSAIRLARAVTGRCKLIKFQGCYHGWHDSVAMNVISPVEKLGKIDPLSQGSLGETLNHTLICEFNSLDEVEQAVAKHPKEVAAIIIEPIAHNVGCLLPEKGFLEGLREISRQDGIVLIFDEVITGFRHHLGGYQKLCGVTPDLTTLGKAMANGYPMAAVCGKRELMDQFNTHANGTVFFAGTFNAHPLTCMAALATIEVIEKQGVHEHTFRLATKMRKGLETIVKSLGITATVVGFGSVFVTYFMEGPIRTYRDLLRNDQKLFVELRRKLLELGILELPLNLKRNHISFSHTDEQIDKTLEATESVLKKLTHASSRSA
jgi:glutamate-1-semialdehyde 2,1-aminomutase